MKRSRHPIAGTCAAVLLSGVWPCGAIALTVDQASIAFNPKKTDAFTLKGRLTNLSLTGAEDVSLHFGTFAETVPLAAFTAKGAKFVYKAPKGSSGLRGIVLDLAKGKFAAVAKSTVLAPFPNPAAFRLSAAGSFDECGILPFTEQAKKWTFTAKGASQAPCVIESAPQVDPAGFFTNVSTSVRVQARLLPDPALDPNSVTLARVDANLQPLGSPLCTLVDDGNTLDGDDISGDGVYSCRASFFETTPGRLRLIVHATLGGVATRSPSVFLDAVDPLTTAEVTTVLADQDAAGTIWEDMAAQVGDTEKARKLAAGKIRELPGVADSGLTKDGFTIWIKYASGLEGGLNLDPPGTPDTGPFDVSLTRASAASAGAYAAAEPASAPPLVATVATASTPEDARVGNNRVLIWSPFADENSPSNGGPDYGLVALFAKSTCPRFNITFLADEACDLDSVRTFPNFGTVIILTHGAPLPGGPPQIGFMTREKSTLISEWFTHALDLKLGRLLVYNGQRRPEKKGYFVFKSSFIENLAGTFPRSVVFAGACSSTANPSMANAFLGKGARAYFGFSTTTYNFFYGFASRSLFENLVTQHLGAADAFAQVPYKQESQVPPLVNLTPLGTKFEFVPTEPRLAYSGDFANGSFETGDLTGWVPSGDGRVIAKLGEFAPSDGKFTGIVSTGLGQTTASGSIEQSFCLPTDAKRLAFDWNFSSEEFIEYCGSQFDDKFQVELDTESSTIGLLSASVNTLCSTVSPTGLAFDRSGPTCTPSDGVGLGTGGNDCKVWSNGWQPASVDLAAIAAANGGKSVTLRISASDTGDSSYDTAVLIDNIRIVR